MVSIKFWDNFYDTSFIFVPKTQKKDKKNSVLGHVFIDTRCFEKIKKTFLKKNSIKKFVF